MRDYAAELAEYARVAAPICGWHPATNRAMGQDIEVALCESHLMDWMGLRFWARVESRGEGWAVNVDYTNDSRLLALIAALSATQP